MGTRNHAHLGFNTAALLSFFNTLESKTGLMVARAAALRTNINIDGRPLPTKKRAGGQQGRLEHGIKKQVYEHVLSREKRAGSRGEEKGDNLTSACGDIHARSNSAVA